MKSTHLCFYRDDWRIVLTEHEQGVWGFDMWRQTVLRTGDKYIIRTDSRMGDTLEGDEKSVKAQAAALAQAIAAPHDDRREFPKELHWRQLSG